MREYLRQTKSSGILEDFFKEFAAGHSCGVILSKCRKGIAARMKEISQAVESVEPNINIELTVDDKTGIIALLMRNESMSDTHFIAILLKEHLTDLDLLCGPLIVADFPENSPVENAVAGMVEQLNAEQSEENPILIYTPQLEPSGTILIVDNDELTCNFISNALSVRGFNVHAAHDGQTGLRLAEQLSPRLIITELMLPVLDGFQFIKSIRERIRSNIMVLTGKRLEADIAKCFDLGAADYMTKPFSPVELEARIRKLFEVNP